MRSCGTGSSLGEGLTVRLSGEDVLRDVGGLADPDSVDGPHSQDVLLLWDNSLLHTVLQLLHRTRVHPHPLLRASLTHLDVVTSDGAAAIPLRGFPGDGQEFAPSSCHMQLNGWRWNSCGMDNGLSWNSFLLHEHFQDLLVVALTCWIFDGEDLRGLARMTNASFILGTDLELDLSSLDDVCHSVLTVWARSLSALHPASSKLLLLLNAIPGEQSRQTLTEH